MNQRNALAVLATAAIAGCGGGSDDDEQAKRPPPPKKLEGPRTEANVVRTLGLKKQGDGYAWGRDCKVRGVAYTKSGVRKLARKSAKNEVVKNKTGTAAVSLVRPKYACAIQAAIKLRQIP